MNPIVLIGFLAFFVASLTVGVRLVLLWRRTRQLPELLIGIGVLGIGPVGFGGMVAGSVMIKNGADPLSAPCQILFATAYATVFVGIIAKLIFNWRVYHPASATARGLVVIMGLALVGLYVHTGVVKHFLPAAKLDPPTLLQSALQVGALLWGSIEALRYWRLMRRRAALGLSDPVVTNRFLLWGIGAGAAGLGTGIGTIASLATGLPSLEIPWVMASSSAHGLTAAVAMSLAFLPPRRYLAMIQRRAARSTG